MCRYLSVHPEITLLSLCLLAFFCTPVAPVGKQTQGLGFGIDCLWLQPKAADLALGSHGWEHPEASV